MMKWILANKIRSILVFIVACLGIFLLWQVILPVPTDSDWKDTLKLLSTAEFSGDSVTVKNIRNFQYDATGKPTVKDYYDKTYDLRQLKKTWYIVDPFDPGSAFAHTYLSFEFSDGSFLSITIEARLNKSQIYSIWGGIVHTYPLMYIAADERDVVYLRTNIFKDQMYMYPLKASPDQGRLLLVDMLERMNDIAVHPVWYTAYNANCTSSIASHVNKIWPGLLPTLDWQAILTGFADKLALDRGLLDTTLPLDEARKQFYVTDKAQEIGYVNEFSELIRR